MNSPTRSCNGASNAVIELDCPWCAAPVLATLGELTDGLACSSCLVRLELAAEPDTTARHDTEPIAA